MTPHNTVSLSTFIAQLRLVLAVGLGFGLLLALCLGIVNAVCWYYEGREARSVEGFAAWRRDAERAVGR